MGSLDVSSDELPISLDDITANDHRLDIRGSCTEVTKARVDSDDVAALNQELCGHDGSNLRYPGAGSESGRCRTPMAAGVGRLLGRSQLRRLDVGASCDKREGGHLYRQSRFARL